MKPIIPLFFAVDDNYAKFLAITLESIFDNASKEYQYDVVVLNTGLKKKSIDLINRYNSDNVSVNFYDVRFKLQTIAQDLSIRDYYSKATYYRLFIADLFPQYKKALYLDCDIVVLGDIAKLYNHDIGNNLVGAITDSAVQVVDEFIEYVEKGLGIKKENYFNAGILLMNLEEFRNYKLEDKFIALLKKYTFEIAQDQDYLNVLCKNKVTYIDDSWNVMPLGYDVRPINLIHYNLSFKPWKYDEIQYQEHFWHYAKQASLEEEIIVLKNSFTSDMAQKDQLGGYTLKVNARKEANSKNNYYNRYVKKHGLFFVASKLKELVCSFFSL